MEYPKHETFLQRYFRNGPGGSYYQSCCYSDCPACAFWMAWHAVDEFFSGTMSWTRAVAEKLQRDREDRARRGTL